MARLLWPTVYISLPQRLQRSDAVFCACYFIYFFFLLSKYRRAEYCEQRMSVCLSVCMFNHEHVSRKTRPNFTKFSAACLIPCVRGVHGNTSCTSGFVDDVGFAHNRLYRQSRRKYGVKSSNSLGERGEKGAVLDRRHKSLVCTSA